MRQTAFRIEPELLEGLHTIKDRIGIPISVQVRRAIRDWIDVHGGMAKAERKRADTRKRSLKQSHAYAVRARGQR